MIYRFVQRDRRKNTTLSRASHLLRGVVVTEKSNMGTTRGQYVFRVGLDANKIEIARAVEMLFDVKVTSVNTLRMPSKLKRFRGVLGKRPSWKKAVVRLKEGQVIDLEGQSA